MSSFFGLARFCLHSWSLRRWLLLHFALCLLPLAAADWVSPTYPPVIAGDGRVFAIDASGNRYVFGGFRGPMDFDPAAGSIDEKNSIDNLSDAFVTRINADGSYAWTQTIGGTGEQAATGALVDISIAGISVAGGNVYVCLWYSGTDLNIGGSGSWSSVGGGSACVVALDATSGGIVTTFGDAGVVMIGSTGGATSRSLVAANGTLYVLGNFGGNDLGIGALGSAAAQVGGSIFIAAIDAETGAAVSAFGSGGLQTIDDEEYTWGNGIAAEGGAVYITGGFSGTALGIGGLGSMATSGNIDIFVAALDATSGQPISGFGTQGLQKIGGSDAEGLSDIATDVNGLYIVGSFAGSDFGVGGLGTVSATNVDGFALALTLDTGLPKPAFGDDGIVVIHADGYARCTWAAVDAGRLAIQGTFIQTTDLGIDGPGIGTHTSSYNGVFLALVTTADGKAVSTFQEDGVVQVTNVWGVWARDVTIFNGKVSMLMRSQDPWVWSDGWGRVEFEADLLRGLLMSWNIASGSPVRSQNLRMEPIKPRILGDVPFALQITPDPSSGNSISVVSTNASVATVSGTTVTVQGVGTCQIIATQGGGDGFSAVSVARPFTIVADRVSPSFPPQLRAAEHLAVGADGSSYLLGSFGGSVDFDPRAGHGDVLTSAQYFSNLYVTRFRADGSYAWSQVIYSSLPVYGHGITIAGDRVFVVAYTRSEDVSIGQDRSQTPWVISQQGETVVVALDTATGTAKTGFGRFGIQRIGGTGITFNWPVDVVAEGSRLYVLSDFNCSDLGIGSVGTFAAQGPNSDTLITGLSTQTGAALPGFGSEGLQRITTDDQITPRRLAVANGVLYVSGSFSGGGLGIGSAGSKTSAGGTDGFVAALNGTSGTPMTGFGSDGIIQISSSSNCGLGGIAVDGGTVFVAGSATGDLGLNGPGSVTARSYGPGFVASLNRLTGSPRLGFGSDGVVSIGCDSSVVIKDVVALGGRVGITGTFNGTQLGIGAPGSVDSFGTSCAMILVLNGTSGVADPGFSDDGIEIICDGDGLELANSATRVMAMGTLSGSAAGIGGPGTWDATTGWSTYLLEVTTQGASTTIGTGSGAWSGGGVTATGSSGGCGAGSLTTFAMILGMCVAWFGRRRYS